MAQGIVIRIRRFPFQTPVSARMGLGTQPRYKASAVQCCAMCIFLFFFLKVYNFIKVMAHTYIVFLTMLRPLLI